MRMMFRFCAIVFVTAIFFSFVSCREDTPSPAYIDVTHAEVPNNGLGYLQNSDPATRINAEIPQEITWTARSNSDTFTTAIYFEFSEPVSDLSASQIDFTDGTGWIHHEIGSLSGSGTLWTVDVTTLIAGWVLVWIHKPGFELVNEVAIYRPSLLTWTATPVGTQATNRIDFTFEAPASLELMDIEILDGTGSIAMLTDGDLGGVLGLPRGGISWWVDVTVLRAGSIYVSISGPGTVGFERGAKEVQVWK